MQYPVLKNTPSTVAKYYQVSLSALVSTIGVCMCGFNEGHKLTGVIRGTVFNDDASSLDRLSRGKSTLGSWGLAWSLTTQSLFVTQKLQH